jgi:hypothetical protein
MPSGSGRPPNARISPSRRRSRRAVRRTFHEAGEEREAVALIAKRRSSPDLPEKFDRLQQKLHKKCFRLGMCGTPLSLGQTIGEASGVVDEILRYRPRRLRRHGDDS